MMIWDTGVLVYNVIWCALDLTGLISAYRVHNRVTWGPPPPKKKKKKKMEILEIFLIKIPTANILAW